MYLYRLFDNTKEFDQRGGIKAAVIAAENAEAARNTWIIDEGTHGENVQLNTPNYSVELLGFCSTVEPGVILVDHDYDYIQVKYDWYT